MGEEIKFSFQVDSPTVKRVYRNQNNYLIDYSVGVSKNYCIIYFSSHDLYYPNTEEIFRKEIIRKNRFEWYNIRIKSGYKHIFIRDIQKQYYLNGINNNINTIDGLLELLKAETKGFKVITVGSSAGGFPAVLFGQLLNAVKIFTFNGLFEVKSKLSTTTEQINPIIFREKDNNLINKYFDLFPYINNPASIYYFSSKYSECDKKQYSHVLTLPIHLLLFKTAHHGIPFLKSSLKYIMNLNDDELNQLVNKGEYHPLFFSYKIEGPKALLNLFLLVWKDYIIKKIRLRN
ncbi:MAG: hypothetical protein Q8R96_05785 [Bacteroidota bacterium]|nr:hypothetical protein [Bacteroidota bacterium]